MHYLSTCSALNMDNVFLASALVSMYSKCGSLDDTQGIFVRFSNHNMLFYGVRFLVLVASQMCKPMQSEAIALDRITFVTILSACGSKHACIEVCARTVSIGQGKQIHARVLKVSGTQFLMC